MFKSILTLLICLVQLTIFATSISPYKNLNHLKESSHAIYFAKVVGIEEVSIGESLEYYSVFQIRDVIKGEILSEIKIKSGNKQIGKVQYTIEGEMDFHVNESYLLFLKNRSDFTFAPICLSYYVFKEVNINGSQLLVPTHNPSDFNVIEKDVEKINYVYRKDEFISSLKSLKVTGSIDMENVVAPVSYQSLNDKLAKMAPGHCGYSNAINRRFRIKNAETNAVPVYYENSGSGCANIGSEMSASINHFNANYTGIDLTVAGTFSGYTPNCVDKAYTIDFFGGNYDTYIDAQYSSLLGRGIFVQFDDPCDDIDDLDDCSGVLAVGGTSGLGSHSLNGESFNTALYGFVVVNNDAGGCHCSNFLLDPSLSVYSLMMTHELTHAVGLAHIEDQFGVANMNPEVNSSITNLDIQCVSDLYPIVTPEPDLIVNCGTLNVSGSNVAFSNIIVSNDGSTNTDISYIGYYLSTDTEITTNDYRLGIDYVSPLAVGGTSTENFSIDAATLNIPDGTYYAGILADYDGRVAESDESNNSCSISSLQVTINTVATEPDLIILNCGAVSMSGNTVTVSNVVVQNSGNATTTPSYIGYYLSSDTNMTTSDYLINYDYVSSLSPGDTSNESTSRDISSLNIPDGTYYLGIIADYRSEIVEGDENNNTCYIIGQTVVVSTASADPDLVVDCGTVSISGTTVSLSNVRVTNQGMGATSTYSYIAYYLSVDTDVTTSDILLGTDYFGVLQVNGVSSESFSLDVSSLNLADGSYYVGVLADYGSRISESNESNNTCVKTSPKLTISTVANEPDLIISNCGAVSMSGNTVTVSNVVVQNSGNATTTPSYIGYYLSSDTNMTTSDYLINYDYVSSLSPGGTSNESTSRDISSLNIPNGTYYLGIIADYRSEIVEGDENNNTCYIIGQTVVVNTVSADPDLVVDCGTVSISGTTVSFNNVKVTNQGMGATSTYSYIAYYLSTDTNITIGDIYLGYDYYNVLQANGESIESFSRDVSSLNLTDGTYYVGIIADFTSRVAESNESNNTCVLSDKITLTPVDIPGCVEIDYADMEDNSMGVWTDGGSGVYINSGSGFANSGTKSVAIRNGDGSQSSIYTGYLLTSDFSSVNLTFSYYPLFDGDFVVESKKISGGWSINKRFYGNGVDFVKDGGHYDVDLNLPTSDTHTQVRIRSLSTSTLIFVDDIRLERCNLSGADIVQTNSQSKFKLDDEEMGLDVLVYPNPIRKTEILSLEFNKLVEDNIQIQIYNQIGALLFDGQFSPETAIKIPTDLMTSGSHLVRIQTADKTIIKKILIL